jgi:phosphohistidine phosphatase
MKLLIVRHAIAEEREDFARTGKDDRLRPLTDDGRKRMKQGARGLRSQARNSAGDASGQSSSISTSRRPP